MGKKQTTDGSLSQEVRSKLWKQILLMAKEASALREAGLLVDAMVCHYAKQHKLYLAEKLTWEGFIDTMGFSRTTVHRYLAAAEIIEAWARMIYQASDEYFIVTTDMVCSFVAARQKSGVPITIKALYEERHPNAKLEHHLRGESAMSSTEFASAMTVEATPATKTQSQSPAAETTRVPARHRDVEMSEDLFATYDRIVAAGYKWDENKLTYYDPKGDAMTVEALAEFVDEGAGLKLLDEAKDVLAPARTKLASQITRYKQYFIAYTKKYQSPKAQEIIKARYDELQAEVLAMFDELGQLMIFDSEA